MSKKNGDPMAKRSPGGEPECARIEAERAKRAYARRMAAKSLCGSVYFREWLYDTLDDLCLYAGDTGLVTEFGQGIRAAANRIKDRLLESPEAVEMFTEMAKRHYSEKHKQKTDKGELV